MSVNNENATLLGRVDIENATVPREYMDVESCQFCQSIYGQRMINYYPQVISCIQEFRSIIRAEYPEIETASTEKNKILDDAYLLTMTEDRVESWEKILGISPLKNSTLEDRRDTIIARIRGQGKLNTELINSIVNVFTGGKANSWVSNSILYVVITPPPNNKQYKFANVEQELSKKVPAHLGFKISRNYFYWTDIQELYSTWQDIKDGFDTWEDVYLYVPSW